MVAAPISPADGPRRTGRPRCSDRPGHFPHLEPPPGREDPLEVPEDLAPSLGWPPAGPSGPKVGRVCDGHKGVPDEEELSPGPVDPGPGLQQQQVGRSAAAVAAPSLPGHVITPEGLDKASIGLVQPVFGRVDSFY
eukprot:15477191-Alexandrium_andersonii.AAC.1